MNKLTHTEILNVLNMLKTKGYINWRLLKEELNSSAKASDMLIFLQHEQIIDEKNGKYVINYRLIDSILLSPKNIDEQLKKESVRNVNMQGIHYEETPSWISVASWWIGGIIGFIYLFGLWASNPDNGFWVVVTSIACGLIFKGISYVILTGILEGGKYAKKGSIAAAKEGSKLLDNATRAVAKKVAIAVEKGKSEAKAEQEKQKLKEQITDLELQYLRKRIEELEKQVDDK